MVRMVLLEVKDAPVCLDPTIASGAGKLSRFPLKVAVAVSTDACGVRERM